MKKIITLFACIALLVTACAALAPAFALSAEVGDDTWSSVKLRALLWQDTAGFFSDLTEEYENMDFFTMNIPELDGEEMDMGMLSMRGFSMTPDRKYALLGHLSGAEGVTARGCALFDFETGKVTDIFYRYDAENADDPSGIPFSHPKGIAADDRGNVYVGFAFSKNYNVVNLGIAHINDETKRFEELYMGAVYEFGDPGDLNGIQVGVNGVEVVKIGEEYFCYVMTNYAYDALYCLNVTDPANPTLNKDFGDNGKIVFSEEGCTVKGDGFTLNDGNYLAVDEEGVVWLAAKSNEGTKGVMKISPDGSSCMEVLTMANPYSVCRAGQYLIVGDGDGVLLHVYDVSDTSREIASIGLDEDVTCGARFARVQVCEDILFVLSSQESTTLPNTLLAAALTADAQVKLNEMVAQLAAPAADDGDESDTVAETEPTTEPATDPSTEPTTEPTTEPSTEPTTEPTTELVTDPTTEPESEPVTGPETDPTTIPETDPATEPVTEPAADTEMGEATTATEDEGCSSAVGAGAAALVLSAMAAAVALKKKN